MNIVAVNVRRLRTRAGISRAELARRAGLSSVKMIESGKREGRLSTHEAIARALGVPVSELFRRPRAERKKKAVAR
jgi:transcriptional regulator with XRE-family HTH domain